MLRFRNLLKILCNLFILIDLYTVIVIAGVGDRDNPITATQTKPVPVTKEVLENKERKGAPAPSFNILNDIARFFVKKPVEKEAEKAEKKRPKLSLFGDEKEYNEDVPVS